MWPIQADQEEVVFGEDAYWLLVDATCFMIEERVSSCKFRVGHKKKFLLYVFPSSHFEGVFICITLRSGGL